MHIIQPLMGTLRMPGHRLADADALWLFNEGSERVVYDLSRYKRTGYFVTNPLFPQWVMGDSGWAIKFTNQAISFGDHVYDNCINELTIVSKFKWNGGGADYGRLCDKYPGPCISVHNGIGTLRFLGYIDGDSRGAAWSANAVIGEWAVWAFRLGNGFQECYKNGHLADDALDGGPYAGVYSTGGANNFYVANRDADMNRHLAADIEFFYIFPRALSVPEIAFVSREPSCMLPDQFAIVA